jgi:hypothetical protein
MRTAISSLAAVLAMTSTGWSEPFDGRWGSDAKACAGESNALLVVTPLALRWRDAACAIRTSYRVREAWHIGARCWADGIGTNVPIKLQMRGQRLLLDWAGGAVEELQRCR